MKKILLIVLGVFITFWSSNVKAYNVIGVESNYYITYDVDGEKKTREVYYAFQGGVVSRIYALNFTDANFREIFRSAGPLSEEQEGMITKIMYYGYRYSNQHSLDYYIATQIMVWQYLYPQYNIYLSDLNKEPLNLLDSCFSIIKNNLINNSTDLFEDNYIEIPINEEKVFDDLNLFETQIYKSDINAKINGQKLVVNSNKKGLYEMILKKPVKEIDFIYYNDGEIYFMEMPKGYYDFWKIKINVLATSFVINSNVDATWGLYDENNNLLLSMFIKDLYISPDFANKNYFLKEIECNEKYNNIETVFYLNDNIKNTFNLDYTLKENEKEMKEPDVLKNPETSNDISPLLLFLPLEMLILVIICLKKAKI